MKSELLYDRYDDKMSTDERKTLIWRYFISYWNNRRICSSNGGLPPIIKRQRYYDSLKESPIPFGGIILATTWGAIHFVSGGAGLEIWNGISTMIFSVLSGVMYLRLNRKCLYSYLFITIGYLLQLPVCQKKPRQKNDVKTEYCLPLGSDYLNRQSATFFIFRNY